MDETSPTDRFLTGPVCAVVAFVVAVLSLMGQNALTVAIGAFAEPAAGNSLSGFYLGFGLALLVQVVLVLLLARRALALGVTGWETTLARASLVIAGVSLVAGVVALLGTAVVGRTY